jgi:hypothetical protein
MIALNFMISTTMNFTGHEIWQPAQHAFCSFNGFMAQLFIIQSKPLLLRDSKIYTETCS